MKKEGERNKKDEIIGAGIAGASYETVQRYGSAVKEQYVAYSGMDNEAGKELVKGLKQIAEEKVNPDYLFQNTHQKAGFSAEVKGVAKTNAERIIRGETGRRIRTDDLGRVNDPLYDTVIVDAKGNIMDGSGVQMKFLGASEKDPEGLGDAVRALNKLQSKKFEKYIENDVKIEVPSNQYDEMLREADVRIESLTKQLKVQRQLGNVERAKELEHRLSNLEKLKANLRKSSLSSKDALFAYEHPKLSTAVDVAKISHRAGLEAGKNAALIGGSISIVKNLVSYCKGDIEADEAVKEVAKDTAATAATGYATGFLGSTVKGAMQNSGSDVMRAISKTNVAGTLATTAVFASKTMIRYFNGEIDGVECLQTLGEQGTGMVSSAMFSVIGQAVIPIPVVGGLVGGMVGYAVSSATYGILVQSLEDEKLAREERIRTEKLCQEYIAMIREYRQEIEQITNAYLMDSMDIFRDSFSNIKNALNIGDVDWFIGNANTITESFGGKTLFSSMDDFEQKMLGETAFIL